jgi:hypothetical protein
MEEGKESAKQKKEVDSGPASYRECDSQWIKINPVYPDQRRKDELEMRLEGKQKPDGEVNLVS